MSLFNVYSLCVVTPEPVKTYLQIVNSSISLSLSVFVLFLCVACGSIVFFVKLSSYFTSLTPWSIPQTIYSPISNRLFHPSSRPSRPFLLQPWARDQATVPTVALPCLSMDTLLHRMITSTITQSTLEWVFNQRGLPLPAQWVKYTQQTS